MTREAWVLILISFLGPFLGVAWFSAIAKWAALLAGQSIGGWTGGLQVAGIVAGLCLSLACLVTASKLTRGE